MKLLCQGKSRGHCHCPHPELSVGLHSCHTVVPVERGGGRENTCRTTETVQAKSTLREGSSCRAVTGGMMPKVGAQCPSLVSSGVSPGMESHLCVRRRIWWSIPECHVEAERNAVTRLALLPFPGEPETLEVQVSWRRARLRSVSACRMRPKSKRFGFTAFRCPVLRTHTESRPNLLRSYFPKLK